MSYHYPVNPERGKTVKAASQTARALVGKGFVNGCCHLDTRHTHCKLKKRMQSATTQDSKTTLFNKYRYESYYEMADAFLNNKPLNLQRFITLMIDMRWEEVPNAFAKAICDTVRAGVSVRETLAEEFHCLVVLAVGTAFGSVRRSTCQPWFLTNWDVFYARVTQTLITEFEDEASVRDPTIFKNCFDVILKLVEGSKMYMSMGFLPYSTSIHAFIVANDRSHATHMRNGYIQMGGTPRKPDNHHYKKLTPAHRVLVECVARRVLKEKSPGCDTWERAFGYYIGSSMWRSLAWRCRLHCETRPPSETFYNWRLERKVLSSLQGPLFVSKHDRQTLEREACKAETKAVKRKRVVFEESGNETDRDVARLDIDVDTHTPKWACVGPQAETVLKDFLQQASQKGRKRLVEGLQDELSKPGAHDQAVAV